MISSSFGTQYKMDKIENKIKIMAAIKAALLVPYGFEHAREISVMADVSPYLERTEN